MAAGRTAFDRRPDCPDAFCCLEELALPCRVRAHDRATGLYPHNTMSVGIRYTTHLHNVGGQEERTLTSPSEGRCRAGSRFPPAFRQTPPRQTAAGKALRDSEAHGGTQRTRINSSARYSRASHPAAARKIWDEKRTMRAQARLINQTLLANISERRCHCGELASELKGEPPFHSQFPGATVGSGGWYRRRFSQ